MTKKQLYSRMHDMLLGANKGYSLMIDEPLMGNIGPAEYFGWIHAVLDEFIPDNHHLRDIRNLHPFADFSTAVDAVWEAIPE